MFVAALKEVEKFTRPVLIATRHFSGEVKSGCGTYIILNPEGWILTASHILETNLLKKQHEKEIAQYELNLERIKNDSRLSPHGRKRELEKLRSNPNWITHIAYWWGKDGVKANERKGNKLADIAVTQLHPFNPLAVRAYPTFWNPEEKLYPGKSLCRLGYPFPTANAIFDSSTNQFSLAPNGLQIPLFPLDGMHTRVVVVETEDASSRAEFIEISTPGLRGQSGGPVFDVEGRVCGIQSQTHHLELGFSPISIQGGREVVENQFLNVGWATHVKEVLNFLHDNHIKVTIAPRTRGEEGV